MTQVHFYDQTCVHVDGYRQIVSFDTTQVLLRCKKNMLVIEGNALRIASFDGAEITVRGDIAAVRWKVEAESMRKWSDICAHRCVIHITGWEVERF